MKISFIIASICRPCQLQQCIASIEKAHERNLDIAIEILVIIQKTKQKKDIQLRYSGVTAFYYMDKTGLSAARNFAIEKSKGDYLVFLDDDAAVKEDFIYVLSSKAEEHDKVNAFCGRLIDPVRRIPFSILFYNNDVKKLRRLDYQYFMGSGHVLSRRVMDRIGYYDERFGVGSGHYGGGEETDIFFRLKMANEQILYLPDLVFYHPTIFPSYDYVRNYAYAFGATLAKNCIHDKAYFFIYTLIALKISTKSAIRLMQKYLLKGTYREKDERYHYGAVLNGVIHGINGFIVNYTKRRTY